MQKLRRTAATGASPIALLEEFAGNECNYGSDSLREDLQEDIASDVRRIAPGVSRPATQMMSRAQTAAVFQASQAPCVRLPLHNLDRLVCHIYGIYYKICLCTSSTVLGGAYL